MKEGGTSREGSKGGNDSKMGRTWDDLRDRRQRRGNSEERWQDAEIRAERREEGMEA